MRNAVQPGSCVTAGCGAAEAEARSLVPDPVGEQRLADLCRALGHPARVHILRVLLAKNLCIAGDLADEVPLAASTVSQHLKTLKESGLIQGEVDGPRRCYCVDPGIVAELKALVARL
jgi:ArsR family transcriptional regulator